LNFIQPTFDNVFQTNPVQTINGSLWTIKIEFFFYLLTPLLIYLYQKINKYLWVATFSIVSYVWTIYFLEFSSSSQAKQFSYQIPGQLIYFVLGGFFSFNKFSKKGFILIPILYFINDYFPYSFLFVATYPFFITFITIFIITLDFNIVSIKRDISYGVYLYHFPLIQLFVYYGLFEVNSYLYLLVMMIILTFLSIFSNLFIEKIKFFN
jgi:peptidoglycan/LPS O-acetylase OafA/YrhL